MTSRLHHRVTHRAFTLVEVLATLVFIGIVLPVAMRGMTVALQATAHARHQVEAAQLGSQKINELLVLRDASTFNGTGDFGDDWKEYRWDSTSQVGDYNLYTVTVNVHWTEQGVERSLPLATLVYINASGTPSAGTGGGA